MGQGDALMAYLPPVGWADVMTRRDLDESAAAIRRDLAEVDQRLSHRIDRLDAEMTHRFDSIDDRLARQPAEITAAFRGEINAAMTSDTADHLRHASVCRSPSRR